MTLDEEKNLRRNIWAGNGSVIMAIVVQSCAAIWWASSLSASVQYLKETVARQEQHISSLIADRYTTQDAERESGKVHDAILELDRRLREIEHRVYTADDRAKVR